VPTRPGFSGDVGCAVSTVIAILGALGRECSEVRTAPCHRSEGSRTIAQPTTRQTACCMFSMSCNVLLLLLQGAALALEKLLRPCATGIC